VAAVLLDTHAWAWSLTDVRSLSERATDTIASASAVYVSPVSFLEIAQKVQRGKWPTMEPVVTRLGGLLSEQGAMVAPLTAEICLDAGLRDWPHRDPFDRLLAATCLRMDVSLVTRDPVFADLGVRSIW
jgi:PIN domain nuclease of toxin-antitoxin system